MGWVTLTVALAVLAGCTVTRATYTRASDGSLVPMPVPPIVVGSPLVECWTWRWGVAPVFFREPAGGPRR